MNIYERSNIQVPDGIIHNNVERLEELNERIHNRIIPDNNVKLNPVFDIRSVPTRNCLIFPVIDFKTSNKKLKNDTHYKIEENFAPIQTKGPFINFVCNVDKESHLRNQIYALQHGAEQSVYVPSSKSDLYNTSVPLSSVNIQQPFTGLFERGRNFVTTQNQYVNNSSIGRDTFHNNTKVQLRTNISEYR
jgi:hypothetical protein